MLETAPARSVDDRRIDWRRLLLRAALVGAVVAGAISLVVVSAIVRAAPTHETAKRLADAVMGNASGPVVVDAEALEALARLDIEVLRAHAGVDRAMQHLDVHDHGFSLPALVFAGLSAGGSTTIATFADEVTRFLRAARVGGGKCCGGYKPERCEIRTRLPRDVRLTDTELVVECRDAADAVLTFLIVDGAVVLVLPDTVARTALAVDAAR